MNENDTNIFGVTEPDDYRCHIMAFVDDVPSLLIIAHKVNHPLSLPHFFLDFRGVRYWEGPLWWAGADFHRGTYVEMMEILEKWFVWSPTLEILNHPFFLLPDPKIREEHFQKQQLKLFKVKSLQGGEVKIIATQVEKSEVMPQSWKSLLYPEIS